jgi:hypothetical protein
MTNRLDSGTSVDKVATTAFKAHMRATKAKF